MAAIYAHRGASAERPENTISAFRRAIELEAFGIELDVHLSRDGIAMVIHDETVDRTTNGSGALADLDFATLRQFDAGGGQVIPTLEEVVDLVAGRAHLNIEVKADTAADEVLRIAQGRSDLSWAMSSFDWDVLRYVHRKDTSIDLWPLAIGATDDLLSLAEEISATQLNLLDAAIDGEIIEFLRARKLGTWVWTVNNEERAKAFSKWGAVGICTDDPAKIQGALS